MPEELTLFSVTTTDSRRLSSRRIAELTEKRHSDVLRDVRVMCKELDITPLVATTQNCVVDSDGVTAEQYPNGDVAQYHLTEHYCFVLASGYNVKLRDAIIGEWGQLKKKHQQALPDFSDPAEAALAYADQAQKYAAEYRRAQKLQAENRELLPRAHVADMLASTEGLHSMSEVAKALHLLSIGPNRLFDIFRKRNIAYRRNGINYPYQRYIDEGYLAVVMTRIFKHGVPEAYPQMMITGKGLAWVMRLVEEERRAGFEHNFGPPTVEQTVERKPPRRDLTVWHGPEGTA